MNKKIDLTIANLIFYYIITLRGDNNMFYNEYFKYQYNKLNNERGRFVNRVEINSRISCNCDYTIKVKLAGRSYLYYCPYCNSIKSRKNNKRLINLENLKFNNITDLYEYQMQLAIGGIIKEMIAQFEDKVTETMNYHFTDRITKIETTKMINNQIQQDTNSVKKKILKKYKSLETLDEPCPLPKF